MTKKRRERQHHSFTSDYRIGGVRYLVSSRFAPPAGDPGKTLTACLKRCLEFAALTENRTENTMKAEYMCPAAGKEE